MQIEVQLIGFLRQTGLPNGFMGGAVSVPDDATVADVLHRVGAGERTPWLVTHNGELARTATVMQDGDTLVIIPPISGGRS